MSIEKHMKQRLAMQIEYMGKNFSGWQRQPGQRCVQSELEKALSTIADQPIEVTCSGRTDKGVHSLGQIIHFDTHAQRDLRGWLLGVNSIMPDDVSVSWVQLVPNDFHARFTATARTYRYLILNTLSRSALYSERALWVYHPLDAKKMHNAAQMFLGEQDFSSLRGSDCQSNTPFRNIRKISVTRKQNWIEIEVTANAFLHHMVRNIVGSLLEIGLEKKPTAWIRQMLAAKDRKLAGITAAAHGLYFIKAHYPQQFDLPDELSYSSLFKV